MGRILSWVFVAPAYRQDLFPAVDADLSMYWDVVELKPEPDCCLFVRFQDGLSGRVLAPLREPQFFNTVFIDADL